MGKIEKTPSLKILEIFFKEMHEWEIKFYSQLRGLLESNASQSNIEDVQLKARKELGKIYDEHGIAGKKNRNRIDGLSLSDPPTYEIEPDILERIEEDDKAEIYLVNKTIGLEGQYRYTLKKKGDRWMLVRREFLDREKKWRIFSF